MIRHIALLTFAPGTGQEEIGRIESALAGLPDRLPGLRRYAYGRDLGIDAGNADFAVVADLDDEAAYAEYRDDPEHRRIITEMIRPVLAGRTAVQFRV